MPEWLAGFPFALIYLILFIASSIRGQVIYWIGRGLNHQGQRSDHAWARKIRTKLNQPDANRTIAWVQKYGWPIVPLAHLTVGIQTVIVATCGMLRMPWLTFTLAQVPGSLAWALIYSTIGFAAWQGLMWLAVTSPWGIAVLVVVGLLALGGGWWLRRKTPTTGPPET